jgi:hypothetical protein
LKGVPRVQFKEVLILFLNELKEALEEFAQKQEAALKKRLKRILTLTVTGAIILAIGIAFGGAAAIFILIGALRYLETFMPSWEAWLIIGAIAAFTAAALFTSLYMIINKELAGSETSTNQDAKEKMTS